MYPDPVFTLLGIPINLYLLLHGMAMVGPLCLVLWLERGKPSSQVLILNVWLGCVAAAAVGGQLINWLAYRWNPQVPLYWSVGKFAAVAAFMIFLRIYHPGIRAQASRWGDLAAPAIALAMVPARLACFASGCCHGRPAVGLPWAVRFDHPHTACLYPGTPVHPVQLYEALGMLLLFIFLMAVRRRLQFSGRLLACLMIGFGMLRFVVEEYRGDARPMLGEISVAQAVSFFVVVAGLFLFLLKFYMPAWQGKHAVEAATSFGDERAAGE